VCDLCVCVCVWTTVFVHTHEAQRGHASARNVGVMD